MKGRDHLGGLHIGERIRLKLKLEIVCEDVGWIHLAQKRVQWSALVYMLMKNLVQ